METSCPGLNFLIGVLIGLFIYLFLTVKKAEKYRKLKDVLEKIKEEKNEKDIS